MIVRNIATSAAVTSAAGLAALFLGNAVAAAEPAPVPPHEPGVVAAGENPPPEERREEPAKNPCKGPWCEVINAAKQLPPPDFSQVDVPKLAEVSVPVSMGVGLPDVVPDIGIPISFPLPDFPAIGVPSLPAPAALPPPPPAPKLQAPKLPSPKLPKLDITKIGQLPF